MTSVFSVLSLILHLAHHIAKFKRSCCKTFAAKRTFTLKAHCAVSSVNWDREFCLCCGVRRSLTSIRKSNGLRTEPCGTPALRLISVEEKLLMLTCMIWPTRKSESQRVILVGRSSLEYFIPESIVPNIVKSFFDVKKSSYYMISSVKASHDGLEQSKVVVISKLSSSEA